MKIVTWNINGIRASNKQIPIKTLLDSLNAEIICLQETKVTRNLLTSDIGNVDDYFAFFSFSRKRGGYSGVVTYCKKHVCPFAAEEGLTDIHTTASTSGTSVGCYKTPADFNMQTLTDLDSEGRCVITEHAFDSGERVCIVNVYCPMAVEENEERYLFKLNFYQLLEKRCRTLHEAGKHVIVLGDLNVSHRIIDHCDPDLETFNSNPSRIWFDSILYRPLLSARKSSPSNAERNEDILTNSFNGGRPISICDNGDWIKQDKTHEGNVYASARNFENEPDNEEETWNWSSQCIQTMNRAENDIPIIDRKCNKLLTAVDLKRDKLFVDVFRYFHPAQQGAFTCWNTKMRARETNYGTRIDYVLSTYLLANTVFTECKIRPDIHGSDHCPVEAYFSKKFIKSPVVPKCCAIFMKECCGIQRGIKSFFTTNPRKRELEIDSFNSHEIKKSKKQKFGSKNTKNFLNYFQKTKKQDSATSKNHKFSDESEITKRMIDNENASIREMHLDSVKWNGNVGDLEILPACFDKEPSKQTKTEESLKWSTIFKAPEKPPLCDGHGKPSVLRTVKKEGPNFGRQFYSCSKPVGLSSNKEASCNFFKWKIKN